MQLSIFSLLSSRVAANFNAVPPGTQSGVSTQNEGFTLTPPTPNADLSVSLPRTPAGIALPLSPTTLLPDGFAQKITALLNELSNESPWGAFGALPFLTQQPGSPFPLPSAFSAQDSDGDAQTGEGISINTAQLLFGYGNELADYAFLAPGFAETVNFNPLTVPLSANLEEFAPPFSGAPAWHESVSGLLSAASQGTGEPSPFTLLSPDTEGLLTGFSAQPFFSPDSGTTVQPGDLSADAFTQFLTRMAAYTQNALAESTALSGISSASLAGQAQEEVSLLTMSTLPAQSFDARHFLPSPHPTVSHNLLLSPEPVTPLEGNEGTISSIGAPLLFAGNGQGHMVRPAQNLSLLASRPANDAAMPLRDSLHLVEGSGPLSEREALTDTAISSLRPVTADMSTAHRPAPSLPSLLTTHQGAHLSPAEQIHLQIMQKADAGGGEFRIQLEPEKLGKLDIRLSLQSDGRASLVIVSDTPDTLAMLQRDARGLERILQQAGLDVDSGSMEFSLQQEGGQNPNEFAAQDQNTPMQSMAFLNEVPEDTTSSSEARPPSGYYQLNLQGGLNIEI